MDDSPYLARRVCPACEPDAFTSGEIVETSYCEPHAPSRAGALDHVVETYGYLSGSAEAGGEDNRAWCALLARKKTLLRGPA